MSIPPENVRLPVAFVFSGGTEIVNWPEME